MTDINILDVFSTTQQNDFLGFLDENIKFIVINLSEFAKKNGFKYPEEYVPYYLKTDSIKYIVPVSHKQYRLSDICLPNDDDHYHNTKLIYNPYNETFVTKTLIRVPHTILYKKNLSREDIEKRELVIQDYIKMLGSVINIGKKKAAKIVEIELKELLSNTLFEDKYQFSAYNISLLFDHDFSSHTYKLCIDMDIRMINTKKSKPGKKTIKAKNGFITVPCVK